ncbi:MAG: D-alanyl-D-alanine carboxypeptidase/D-alanyl-D-alanine-endopeptidase [Parahaliea sp.]
MAWGLSLTVPAPADDTGDSWTAELNRYATRALDNPEALSLAAVPLDGPGTAQFLRADRPMIPGSLIKLLTSYAALELLGPHFTWNTDFLTDGSVQGDILEGNLYVRFGGDPKLSTGRLWSVLGELRGMGISHIEGDLVLDGHYFQLSGDWLPFADNGDDPHAPFLVEPSNYLTNLNLQHFQVVADERGTRAWSTPELAGVNIDNQVTSTPAGPCPREDPLAWQPAVDGGLGATVHIRGKLPQGCRAGAYFSLLPQGRYSALLIRALLAQHRVTLSGADRFDTTPDTARLLAHTESPDLVSMARDINKWSNNVMTRQLLLTIGAHARKEGERDDRAAGLRAINGWLAQKGLDTTTLVLDNGAGLSRRSRITARQGVALLQKAWRSPYAPDLLATLPIIGLDGTMAERLQDTAVRGQGRVKTGSLDHVRSIAGITRDRHNTSWAVVAIVNNRPAWNGQAVLDRVLYNLYFKPPVP